MSQLDNRQLTFLKKLVSNARAILTNQVALPLGVHKIHSIIHWLDVPNPVEDLDLGVFQHYWLNVDELPIGTERLYWNIDKLIEFETEFDQVNQRFRADVLRKCREIIDKYADLALAPVEESE